MPMMLLNWWLNPYMSLCRRIRHSFQLIFMADLSGRIAKHQAKHYDICKKLYAFYGNLYIKQ